MKRTTIRNSTVGIIIFCTLSFVVIFIAGYYSLKRSFLSSPNRENGVLTWSDTISNQPVPESLLPMEKVITRFMEKWDVRGMQIAVSRNDSLLFTKGYGYADKEKGIPMQANTIMRIASSSKLITAAAVAKLVESAKLKLTDTVFGERGVLNNPEYTEAIADKRLLTVTVGNLLRHEGGFTLAAGDPMFNTRDIVHAKKLDNAPSNRELVRIVLGRRLGFQPGSGHRYSNFGYFLLSLIIEKVSGMSYWEYVEDKILNPAGVNGMRPATNYYEDKWPGEAKYYAPDDELVEEFKGNGRMVERPYGGTNMRGLMGAGGWLSSAADLCRFVAAIDGDNRFADILSPRSVKAMTLPTDSESERGFGWTKTDEKGNWMRSGTLSSGHSLIARFPDGECWVITMNTGVWRGFHFTRDLQNLVNRLRKDYSSLLPRQNIF